MLLSRSNGATSVIVRVKLLDSSVTTGAGLTGLTSASSGLIISTIADVEATATTYTVAGSTVESITTLGTYAAPTATKCRFKEVDATNHKGVYELHFADARFAVSGAKHLLVSLLGATNLQQTDFVIDLSAGADVRSFGGTAGTFASGIPSVALTTASQNATAGAVWDVATSSHVSSGSFGAQLQAPNSGTAQAGASTTITLASGASATNDFYKNCGIYILSGTGVGQFRFISGYVGSTKVATVPAWATNPDATSVYTIIPFGAIAGATAPTASENAIAVWDELRASHTTAGTFGQYFQTVARAATAQGGTSSSITLDASASATNDLYKYSAISIIGGTGAGQSRQISGYTGSSKVATVGVNWTTAPDSTSVFMITPLGVDAATIAAIATGVWSATRAGNATAGTFGEYVNADTQRLAGNATAAANAKNAFDGSTGFGFTGCTIPTVTTVTTVSGLAANSVNASALASDAVTEIQTGLATSTALTAAAGDITTILGQTGTTGVVVAAASKTGYALSTTGIDALFTRQLTESYAADGAAPTVAQSLMLIQQLLGDFSISGTTLTLKKVDGSTTAATFTLNSASAPTSITRAT